LAEDVLRLAIDKRVGNVRNDGRELIKPLTEVEPDLDLTVIRP
jgi:hypothetical protein